MNDLDEDRYDIIGVVLERPIAEKFREMCKPNTVEEVIDTFVRNVIKSGIGRGNDEEYDACWETKR
jgi:hypothetical protein